MSDYGARRIWHDVLAERLSCGLHRIERLMRQNGLRARPRRRGLAAESTGHKTIMIDATYLKAHRTASSLQVEKGGEAARSGA